MDGLPFRILVQVFSFVGLVWAWFGLVWPCVGSVKSLCFPMIPLGLALVWLGLAGFGFCEIIIFSNESAWFGIGLAWFGRVCVL